VDKDRRRRHIPANKRRPLKRQAREARSMANDPERITILAREFTTAALEFHRGRMAEKGYRMEGAITSRIFKMIEGLEAPEDLFDGATLFAVTFVKKD
jgi:hypothetical protein